LVLGFNRITGWSLCISAPFMVGHGLIQRNFNNKGRCILISGMKYDDSANMIIGENHAPASKTGKCYTKDC
jgi:hypothetical protein